MMAWTPRERPANTQAILQRLEQMDKTLPSPTPIPVDPSPSPPIENNNGSEKAPSCPPSYLRFSILIFIIGLLSSILYMGIPMLVGGILAMISRLE